MPDLELSRQDVDVISSGLCRMVKLFVRQQESTSEVVGQPNPGHTNGLGAQLLGTGENRRHGFGLRQQRQLRGHLKCALAGREPMRDAQNPCVRVEPAFRRIRKRPTLGHGDGDTVVLLQDRGQLRVETADVQPVVLE
ncbi:Uncharacterised protein [Mycobacteroides abscessus subsp. massiliense]|nr:Uncharacterised protein [Mycobacteroides abscessus subsp. massiliense]